MLNRIVPLVAACATALVGSAQISHEGSPSAWGTPWMPEVEYVVTEALDWAAIQAADSVTDQYKEAPWRFGMEREVNFNLGNSGSWTVEGGERV